MYQLQVTRVTSTVTSRTFTSNFFLVTQVLLVIFCLHYAKTFTKRIML